MAFWLSMPHPNRHLSAWGRPLLVRYDRDHTALTAALELDLAGRAGVDRVVPAHAGALTGLEARSTLADDDLAPGDRLAGKNLYAEALGIRVTAVAGGPEALFMCHQLPPLAWRAGAAEQDAWGSL